MRAVMVGALLLVTSAGWAQTVTRPPYLQSATQTSVVVVWDTLTSSTAQVRYGTAPDQLTQQVQDTNASTHHEIQLTGLTAGTRYFYSAGTTTTVLRGGDAAHVFTTAPVVGSKVPLRAWVVGDSGTGGTAQRNVRDAMVAAVGESQPELFIHVGDMAYNSGTTLEFTLNFFGQYGAQLARMITWPAIGNHEGTSSDSASQTGPYYEAYVLPTAGQSGGVPSGTEAYYAFDWANVHFIVLDSHESPRTTAGAMLTWMQQDVAATNQDWIVALWHHPPYTKGTHDSDTESQLVQMRENALPILEAAGVDLVLAGHSHIYERSYLVDGAYDTPTTAGNHILDGQSGVPLMTGPYVKMPGQVAHNGAVYVVAGHGGASLGGSANHPVMAVSDINYGSCILDVHDNRLEMINIRSDGTIQDRFALVKGTALLVGFPVGGESLAVGGNTTIRWVTNGTVARVNVSYSLDGGVTWLVAAADVANTGSLPWTVPLASSTRAMVRVEDATNAGLFDTSNGFFTISSGPQTLVPLDAAWAYNDTGTDQGTAWRDVAFDDSAWPRGNAQLGYGDSDEATTLTRRSPTQPSYYFRHAFTLDRAVDSASLQVTYDDGVTVWINGVEVLARNMLLGTAYGTFASAQSGDNEMATATLTGAMPFVVGPNVITAMVKQVDASSSDVSFALRLDATLVVPPAPDGGVAPDAGGPTPSSSGPAPSSSTALASSGAATSTSTMVASSSGASSAAVSGSTSRGSSLSSNSNPGSSGVAATSTAGAASNASSAGGGDPATPGCGCVAQNAGAPGDVLAAALGLAAFLFWRRRFFRR